MHLPLDHKKWLLDLFNQSLHSAIVPKSWKVALIVPIPKPAKCLTSVSSYRPISLLSCISKLLEALINKRLGFFLEKNDSLRPSQGGFRRRLAGVDQIARLEAAIRTALTNRSPLVAVFCDLSNAFDRVWHTGLLYKLSQCGVHGALLRWLRDYLADRSFCVQFEGQTSSSRKIKSGVPQGAILSPLLFNVMMRDLPSVLGVHTADYADDVAFFSYGPDLVITTDKIQTQLNKFFEWTKMWGLSINHLKTKCMLFTNKKVTAIPLSINGSNLEYVKQHRYLGVILDAPWLRWEPQISSLKLSCIPITNLLQSISSRHWGADRALLLKLYRVLIRSRLDYAAAFYASAAPTNLRKLNVIQNNCLRIALGCRRTTPVPSMEVEAHIPPLSVHRNELLCKYYFRLIQLPHCPIVTELFHQNVPPCLPNRALCQPISFISHARAIMSTLQIPVPHMLASPLVSPLPPWFNVDEYFLDQFSSATVSVTSSEAAVQIFSDMTNSKFLTHTAIYTDGSQIKTPTPSTSAALFIPSKGVLLSWKLRPEVEVIESELFAIREALHWSQNNLTTEKIVIFTDSQASIHLIKNRQPSCYLSLIFQIQSKIMSLTSSHEVYIQYIPGHKGISGNETADRAAKDAHSLRYRTVTVMSREELVRLANDRVQASWNQSWLDNVNNSGKGHFLTLIKNKVGFWP